MTNILIFAAFGLTAALLLWPRLSGDTLWRASITPLASIIGSGFLVIGPILDASYGKYAPVGMVVLCAVAYAFGGAIRFNIARVGDQVSARSTAEERMETVASWTLAFAYVISVAYYLNLLGAFSVSLTPYDTTFNARVVTTLVYVLILVVGWTKGFSALERLEQVSVGVKLAIIAGLLMGLALYFGQEVQADALVFTPPEKTGWPALTLAFGLLVTVQGFETSRYLSADYDARTRIRSMKVAQGLSTAIYMVYVLLMAYVFAPDTLVLSETAIVDLMQIVAPVLPILLVAAAVAAQFSAAVADTSGSGGLLAELSRRRVTPHQGYAIIVGIGIALTWLTSVFELISYGSRAFAAYYGIQAAIAALGAVKSRAGLGRILGFGGLACLGILITIFGVAVE